MKKKKKYKYVESYLEYFEYLPEQGSSDVMGGLKEFEEEEDNIVEEGDTEEEDWVAFIKIK